MLNLRPIVHALLEDYALPRHGTHGVGHWARVLENGWRLATATGAVVEVVQLFAVFHDSGRETINAKAVVLNLAAVHNLGADGLGMLVRFHGQARAKGIAFTLSSLTPPHREHVRLDGLDRLFTIVDDEAAALAAFAKVDQEDAPA